MTECVTRDALIDVATAAPGPALEFVDHLAHCEECRQELAVVDAIRDPASADSPVPAEFTATVMRRIEAEPAADARPQTESDSTPVRPRALSTSPLRRLRAVAAALLQAVLVAGAIVTVLTAAAAGSPTTSGLSLSPSPAHLALAFVLALGLGVASAVRSGTPDDDGVLG